MTKQGDMATQDDVTFYGMTVEKYHLEVQEFSLEELYLAMEISLRKQANNDLTEAKLNKETFTFSKKNNLKNQLLRGQIYVEA